MSFHLGSDLAPLLPVLMVLATGLVVMVVDIAAVREPRIHAGASLVGLALAGVMAWFQWGRRPADVFAIAGLGRTGFPRVVVDGFAVYAWLVLLAVAALTVLVSTRYLDGRGMAPGPYFALVNLSAAAMMLLAAANDLVVMFLALETFSLAFYVLTGYRHTEAAAREAALKYFVLGSFAAAFFLYGTALVYASFGATALAAVAAHSLTLSDSLPVGLQVPLAVQAAALGMVLVGLGFKASIVPFHQWTADVYTGAPAPVTGFMAAGTKVAAFTALVRVLWVGFPHLTNLWLPVVTAAAVLTMAVGNLMALVQGNIKRMLAFSAIGHAGYLLAAVAAGPPEGTTAALFYVLVYGLATVGAFGVLAALGPGAEGGDAASLDDLRGLGRRHPGLAMAMAIFLLSLTGLPPTAGFLGKWFIFQALVGANLTPLSVVVVVASVVSAFAYLRPVAAMYMAAGPDEAVPEVAGGQGVALAVSALVVALALVLTVPMAKGAAFAVLGSDTAMAPAGAPEAGPGLIFVAPEFEKKSPGTSP